MATPLVPTPPLTAVRARANRYVAVRRRRNALVASILIGLTVTSITKLTLTSNVDSVRLVGEPGGPKAPAVTTTTAPAVPLPALDAQIPFLPSSGHDFNGHWGTLRQRGANCPVLADHSLPTVKVAVGHVPGTTLEPSPNDAVRRVVQAFNNVASICGRAVELVPVVDHTNIPPDVVSVLGLPLDRSLETAIADRRFEFNGLPVIGGDGLSAAQHSSPAVYPVGTSAAALARIATQHAWEQGARTFAVVYDNSRAFGGEAATALAEHVRRAGGSLRASIGLDPSAAADAAKSEEFGRGCANGACDVVFLALLPETAATWLAANPHAPRLGTATLPTLLTRGFADACFAGANMCDELTAWTGFIPPFGRHAGNVEAIDAWTPSWAEQKKGSAMIEAAVVSTRVLLEALLEAGPTVTRARLRQALDKLVFVSQVTSPLRWTTSGPRVGNATAQAWQLTAGPLQARPAPEPSSDWEKQNQEIIELQNWLSNADPRRDWREVGTGWRTDPH